MDEGSWRGLCIWNEGKPCCFVKILVSAGVLSIYLAFPFETSSHYVAMADLELIGWYGPSVSQMLGYSCVPPCLTSVQS